MPESGCQSIGVAQNMITYSGKIDGYEKQIKFTFYSTGSAYGHICPAQNSKRINR